MTLRHSLPALLAILGILICVIVSSVCCEMCRKNYTKETVCSNCIDNYNTMNKTRLNWSHELNCCKDRKTSLTTFIVTSVMISVVIPFVFYTSFMFFGWRRDQIQQPLADSDVHHSEERTQTFEAIAPSAVPAITNLLDLE